jgi:hypothetical protein
MREREREKKRQRQTQRLRKRQRQTERERERRQHTAAICNDMYETRKWIPLNTSLPREDHETEWAYHFVLKTDLN